MLSGLSVAYFLTEPLYSLYIEPTDIPYFIIIAAFALLIAGFSSIRRRIEQVLREARDKLEIELAERTRQASLLNLTHDTIFVRDMSDVITYWNRGAQELFGWTAEEAIGKHAHQLLQTVFPMPIDAIDAELLRTGGWEGELEKIKADGTRVVVSGRWSLVRDEQERPVAILATNNDITQRKRSDEIGCADGGEDEIVVFIRDNGIGFDMKYVKKLFGVFQRLHRTEEFEGHWYGIG